MAKSRREDEEPLAWFLSGHAYLQGAAILQAAEKPDAARYGAPPRFLYFHAIELLLKAFLRLSGVEGAALAKKPYGHDLCYLASEAERFGLTIGRRVRTVCDLAALPDEWAEEPLETRYIRTGWRRRLPATRLHEAGRDLQSRVEAALRERGIATPALPDLPLVHSTTRRLTVAKAAKILSRL